MATMKKDNPTRREMVAAANDLNQILRLMPPIGLPEDADYNPNVPLPTDEEELRAVVDKYLRLADPRKMGESELKSALISEAKELQESDDVRPNTRKILKHLLGSIIPDESPVAEAVIETAQDMEPSASVSKKKNKKAPVKKTPVAKTKSALKTEKQSKMVRKDIFFTCINKLVNPTGTTKGTTVDAFSDEVIAMIKTQARDTRIGKIKYQCKFLLELLTELKILQLTDKGWYIKNN